MKRLKEKGKKNSKTVLGFIIGMIVSSVTAYLTTTYALTENNYPIHSENVEYTDSFNLGAYDVQAAIENTFSKTASINTRLTSMENNLGNQYIQEFNFDKSVINTSAWGVTKFDLMTLSSGYYLMYFMVETPAFESNVLFRLYADNGSLLAASRDTSNNYWNHYATLVAFPSIKTTNHLYIQMINDSSKISSFVNSRPVTITCRWIRISDWKQEIES